MIDLTQDILERAPLRLVTGAYKDPLVPDARLDPKGWKP